MNSNTKIISQNRKASHNYFIVESMEAGIELYGTEVKSLRNGSANIKDSWCAVIGGELFVNNMHIGAYEKGNIFNKDPLRVRKLLVHKKEIFKLFGQTKLQGYSIIPLSLYFKGSYVKMKVGLCKGKKLYDKRAELAKKSALRDIDRAYKEKNKF